jgi:hypothetical protein
MGNCAPRYKDRVKTRRAPAHGTSRGFTNSLGMPSAVFTTQRPVEYFMLQEPRAAGALVGYLAGQAIPEHMTDCFGRRYSFAGVASRLADGRYDVEVLRTDEWLVEPGLIYAGEGPFRRKAH